MFLGRNLMLPGVYSATKKDGTIFYRSSITFKNKHISLGSYSTEEQAHTAYLVACDIVFNKQHSIHDFTGIALPFDKAICLINLRDNGLYFHNPIYLREKYFEYYLTPDKHLKFDADDLFYYSKHKIMVRGGHMFVSDYGMQVNILSRFGIGKYAVPGRDYFFINGDHTDFRYNNIEVINKYFGVFRQGRENNYRYIAKIHIKGTVKIGTYPTESMAAIAYNKAADILNANGLQKEFNKNYIEDMNAIEYSGIYNKIRISPYIIGFTV